MLILRLRRLRGWGGQTAGGLGNDEFFAGGIRHVYQGNRANYDAEVSGGNATVTGTSGSDRNDTNVGILRGRRIRASIWVRSTLGAGESGWTNR